VVSVAEPPRRERKKRQTRDALVHAALKLFDAKGYELTALRNAFAASLRAITADPGHPGEESVYLLIVKLIETTPSLLAAQLRYMRDRDDELVRVLAAREGVDPVADLRPRVAAVIFGALVATATRQWRTDGCGTVDEMLAAFDACLEQVGPALAGHWTAR